MAGVHFLDWRPHNRRAETLAEDLQATLWLAPDRLRRKSLAPVRYGFLLIRTLKILLDNRPDIIIATSPPSLCPIVVYVYSRFARCKYVVDAHHLATTGFWWRFPFGARFNRFIMRKAIATLVHNQAIERLARAEGIRAITLETKIPELQADASSISASATFSVLTPCSFDPDEPISAIYEAAASLPSLTFYLTGDRKRLNAGLRKRAPRNVILTGFMTQEEYDSLLRRCDVVLAMATNDYPVRPRAASEAIAAGKPLVASRNEATEIHLGNAAILVRNTATDILQALEGVQERYELYQSATEEVRQERRERYEIELKRLEELLASVTHAPTDNPSVGRG